MFCFHPVFPGSMILAYPVFMKKIDIIYDGSVNISTRL